MFHFVHFGQGHFWTNTCNNYTQLRLSGGGRFSISSFPNTNMCNKAPTQLIFSWTIFCKVSSEQFVVISTKALHNGISFMTFRSSPSPCSCSVSWCTVHRWHTSNDQYAQVRSHTTLWPSKYQVCILLTSDTFGECSDQFRARSYKMVCLQTLRKATVRFDMYVSLSA